MDPTVTLIAILAIARRLTTSSDGAGADAEHLAQLTLDLDEWFKKGGFLPQQWAGASLDGCARIVEVVPAMHTPVPAAWCSRCRGVIVDPPNPRCGTCETTLVQLYVAGAT